MKFSCLYCGVKLNGENKTLYYEDNGIALVEHSSDYKCFNHNINIVFNRAAYTNYYRYVELSDKDTMINIVLDKFASNAGSKLFVNSGKSWVFKECSLLKKMNVNPDNWNKLKLLLVFS
jgi:hypothetical protein